MTISDAAKIHHISERTIRRWIAEGKLRSVEHGGVTHVHRAQVEAVAHEWRSKEKRGKARPRHLLT